MSNKRNIFWIGYSDLMTSLFFIVLVMFVVTTGFLKVKETEVVGLANTQDSLITELKKRQGELEIEIERYRTLTKLEEQFQPLENNPRFYYLAECKKFIARDLMGIEIFDPLSTQIRPQFIDRTIQVGRDIEDFLADLHRKNPHLTYLLIIEGNMANTWDRRVDVDNRWGYETSYKRALEVYQLWVRHNIDLRSYNTEIVICGSGFNGLCRDPEEENNKRFSIQIIPKTENRII